MLLQKGREINQEVAARNQIKLSKGRVNRDVMTREKANIPQRFDDPIAPSLHFYKKPLQAFRRNVLTDAFRVFPNSRFLDGLVADIRSEDLNGSAGRSVTQEFHEEYGYGIDL